MSLFRNKFSPKKGPTRKFPSMSNLNLDASEKLQEFGIDMSGPLRLRLGSNEMIFADGMWISESAGGVSNHREIMQTKKENQHVSEENNMLKIKIELLLDMLSEKTAEVHLMENEMEQLKKLAKKR